MRLVLALALFLLGLNSAAREPEYFSRSAGGAGAADANSGSSLVEIESSNGRGDRLTAEALGPRALHVEILRRVIFDPSLRFASASADIGPEAAARALLDANPTGTDADPGRSTEVTLDDRCNALFSSAQDNDLPVPFFANLLWQESRLKDDVVSSKGALGIAQFMPEVAAETGLADPFDPMQAIPASARLLHDLRMQFGNLGYVAAAYNAGAHRVAQWLEHRRGLPRETRDYVVKVTGLSADVWRKASVDETTLPFVRHLPCRSLPAFAGVEEEQQEQLAEDGEETGKADETRVPSSSDEDESEHAADHRALHRHSRHQARRLIHEHHAGRHEAAHHPHLTREKRKSV